MENSQESSGEDLIADFLEEKGIEFKRYPVIQRLRDDTMFFREADFYLPRYDVFIEFLGQWNDPAQKHRYKQKMAVYHKNAIPCIYFWPDNLGTLDWMLKRRLRETLLKYNRRWALLKFEFENYTEEYGLILLGIGFFIYYIKQTGWRIGITMYLFFIMYVSINKYIQRLGKIKIPTAPRGGVFLMFQIPPNAVGGY